jgi:phosphoserine phosphatase
LQEEKDHKESFEQLNSKLLEIRNERDKLNVVTSNLANRRALFHDELKELREELIKLKQRRNDISKDITDLLKIKREHREKNREKIFKIKKLRKKFNALLLKKPERSFSSLKQEVQNIDWKIQTNSLSMIQENSLVKQVQILESQLNKYRDIERIKNEVNELQKEINISKEKIILLDGKTSKTMMFRQKFYLKFMKRLSDLKKIKKKADDIHEQFIENKEKVRAVHKNYLEILGKVRKYRKIIRDEEKKEKTKKLEELRKNLKKEILKKLKQGKKISLDEFKILNE